MIRSIQKFFRPDSNSSFYTIELDPITGMLKGDFMDLMHQIVEKLAEKYTEDHGDEILKRIQEKTIDSKVIAKVVQNLRKELQVQDKNRCT